MEFVFSLSFACFLMIVVHAQTVNEGQCFNFHGDSYLHFTPNNFDNNNAIHYTLQFNTTQENGIIMYARGLAGDDEALFIRDGKLRYHLFNTSPTGVEGYFGAYLEGDELVNINKWIKVDVFRSWDHYDKKQRIRKQKTGFEVEIDGQTFSHVDYLDRSDISIQPIIYFGGYRSSLSSTLQNFVGQIREISEEKNRYSFDNPSLNYRSKVGLGCTDYTPN